MTPMPFPLDVTFAEGEPRRFALGDRPIEVVEILDRWPGADHLYVKLRGGDGGLYILRHDLSRDRWELILFERAREGRPGS